MYYDQEEDDDGYSLGTAASYLGDFSNGLSSVTGQTQPAAQSSGQKIVDYHDYINKAPSYIGNDEDRESKNYEGKAVRSGDGGLLKGVFSIVKSLYGG